MVKVFYTDYMGKHAKIMSENEFETFKLEHEIENWRTIQDLSNVSRKELLLHAVLLLRTVNRYDSKERQMELLDDSLSNKSLIDYIYHFDDPEPERKWDEEDWDTPPFDDDYHAYTSCTNGDYGPSNPWDAPGMSICDFI